MVKSKKMKTIYYTVEKKEKFKSIRLYTIKKNKPILIVYFNVALNKVNESELMKWANETAFVDANVVTFDQL